MMKLCIATGNMGKVREMRELLGDLPIEILCLSDFENIEEVPETGTSFLENCCQKVTGYGTQTGCICVGDDSGLCVDALNGGPGIYSARFADTDKEKCEKLLALMENERERSAHFCCFASVYFPQGVPDSVKNAKDGDFHIVSENIVSCNGVLEGGIGYECRGDEGFGFDPVFTVGDRHLAELSSEEKNAISHRGKAMRKIRKILELVIKDQG
ncbi:MAG: RdgB/HAM1 family non-canonical purine NTP pyrophosphatase [Armatimonadetes bacterium]|nr:RdgB/HAM1 family non-canonical purine NTP pyrophosphatase [Candidatus Hippobium faecium]